MENFKIGDVVKASSKPMLGVGYEQVWEKGIKEIGSNALGIVYEIKPEKDGNTLYGVQWFRGKMAKSFGHYLESSKNKNLSLFTKTGYTSCWWTRQNVLEKFDFKEDGKALGRGLRLCENDGEEKYACIGDRVFVPQYELKGTVVAIRNVDLTGGHNYFYGVRFDNVKYPDNLIPNSLLGLLSKNDNSGKWLPKEYFSVIHRISELTGIEPCVSHETKRNTPDEKILQKIRKLFFFVF